MTMTEDDPQLSEGIWRAIDLTRAYAVGDSEAVARHLAGLDTAMLELVFSWLVLRYDDALELMDSTMEVRQINAVAALAPPEHEFAVTTATRRIADGECGMKDAVAGLPLLDRIHAMAVYTVVTIQQQLGSVGALEFLDAAAQRATELGMPRPYELS